MPASGSVLLAAFWGSAWSWLGLAVVTIGGLAFTVYWDAIQKIIEPHVESHLRRFLRKASKRRRLRWLGRFDRRPEPSAEADPEPGPQIPGPPVPESPPVDLRLSYPGRPLFGWNELSERRRWERIFPINGVNWRCETTPNFLVGMPEPECPDCTDDMQYALDVDLEEVGTLIECSNGGCRRKATFSLSLNPLIDAVTHEIAGRLRRESRGRP